MFKPFNLSLLKRSHNLFKAFIKAISIPLLLMLGAALLFIAYRVLIPSLWHITVVPSLDLLFINLLKLVIMSSALWLSIRLIKVISHYVQARWHSAKITVLVPVISSGAKVIVSILIVNLFLPYFSLPATYLYALGKLLNFFLVIALTWLIILLLDGIERYIVNYYHTNIYENLHSSKVYTQIKLLKKVVISLVVILGAAFALMVFDKAREFGMSILASAGLIAAIVGFAAQRALANQIAGIQIALTQPIKINDAVLIENEFGNIEEITLSYVVIKLWDWRRLVVPINYFIEKPFQNWSRQSRDLLGTVMFYINADFPVATIRKQFMSILAESELWDKKVAVVHVTDTKGTVLELRLLMSADSAPHLWDLRCEVREKLSEFMRINHPKQLPSLYCHGTSYSM